MKCVFLHIPVPLRPPSPPCHPDFQKCNSGAAITSWMWTLWRGPFLVFCANKKINHIERWWNVWREWHPTPGVILWHNDAAIVPKGQLIISAPLSLLTFSGLSRDTWGHSSAASESPLSFRWTRTRTALPQFEHCKIKVFPQSFPWLVPFFIVLWTSQFRDLPGSGAVLHLHKLEVELFHHRLFFFSRKVEVPVEQNGAQCTEFGTEPC